VESAFKVCSLRRAAGLTASALRRGLAWTCVGAALIHPALVIAQQQQHEKKEAKNAVLRWNPPQVDWRLKPLIAEPPCLLPSALAKAAEGADRIFGNLKSFTAREDVRFQAVAYQPILEQEIPLDDFARSYDYTVFFKQTREGFEAQDNRKPLGRSSLQLNFDQDLGLTELALLFLSGMQADYEFKCEGTVLRHGEPAWVIRFQQRKDKPRRTISFRGEGQAYPASLRGRAWIATGSGEVQHMETMLMDRIPEVNVRQWYFSIDYAQVVFSSNNVRMSLPQTVDVYVAYDGNRRTIAKHTFTDFRLFSATITLKP
jgi:hypothetical protein